MIPLRIRHWLGVIVLPLVLAACGGGDRNTGSTAGGSMTPSDFDFGTNSPLNATAFGDSITQGELGERARSALTRAVVTRNAYPNILQSMLQGLNPDWRVVNRGRGGEGTAAGVRRLPGLLGTDRPGFVLIMEGTNDATEEDDPAFIVANLEQMVDQVRANQSIPVLATIPPNFRNHPAAREIVEEANVLIRSMASARRVVLAEIFNGMNDRALFGQGEGRDPLHPNDQGYQVMAGIWFDALRRAIPAPVTPSPPSGPATAPPREAGQRAKRP